MKKFIAGKTYIPVAQQVIGEEEPAALIEVARSGNFSYGIQSRHFEQKLSDFTAQKFVTLCNSGSSSDLLALSAIVEKYPRVKGKIVTCATGFPTTVNPILQMGYDVIFVDVDKKTLNPVLWQLMTTLGWGDVIGAILTHNLGFPFAEDRVSEKCKEGGKFLISDCCDAMGSTISYMPVGSWSDCSTYSFYPAHTISCGEGGAVITNDEELYRIIESYNNWGRDCYCKPGVDNTCFKRFAQQFGELPEGYDHKYVFSRLGYNFKMTEMQAALGSAQMNKVEDFVSVRKSNYTYLKSSLSILHEYFDLVEPLESSFPSPFGFPLTVKESAPFTRGRLIRFLENRKIGTRMVFGGNLLRQPAYLDNPNIITPWPCEGSDFVMNNTFWVGCHPGLTVEMMQYMVENIFEFAQGL